MSQIDVRRLVWHEHDRNYTVCGIKITSGVLVRGPGGTVTCKRCKKSLDVARRIAERSRL